VSDVLATGAERAPVHTDDRTGGDDSPGPGVETFGTAQEDVSIANRKQTRKAPRRRRGQAMRLAVFGSEPSLARALESLEGGPALHVTRFDPRDFVKKDFRPEPYDAIFVEQEGGSESLARLVRWLKKANPGVPLVAYGEEGENKRSPGARSAFALHLNELPSKAMLVSLVRDARRHVETARKAADSSRRLRETSHRLQVLGEIVATANSILEPRRVLNVIMSRIQELIPSEAWSILLVDEETGDLTFEMALGEKGSDLSSTRIKMGEGVAGWVAQTGEAAIVNDVKRDKRFQHRFDVLTRFQTRAILCAPLTSRGRTIGVVEIMNPSSGSRFTRKELNLLLTLVEPAAIALENAILFQKTQRLAVTDDLTKLYNSRYLTSFLEEAIRRAKDEDGQLAVVFLDLDGFKSINDRHGHLYGSRTLSEVARIVGNAVREEDVVSRYGGDEFVVILPDTDGAGAFKVAERIRRSLNEHVFLEEYGLEASLSASFGVSLFPDHGEGPQDLMQKADQAMYSVKERGKDAVCLAT